MKSVVTGVVLSVAMTAFAVTCGKPGGGATPAPTEASASRTGHDWPNWRGPNHNGISDETGWLEPWTQGKVRQLWKQSVGTGFSSMAVADGRVYTAGFSSNRDTLYCFDAATGKELWKYPYPAAKGDKYYEGGPHATPTVDGGSVYFVSKWGQVFRLDAKTGREVWKRDLAADAKAATPTWAFATSPLIVGDVIYLNIGSAGAAIDKATGKTVWTSGPGEAGYATPVACTADGLPCLAIFGKSALIGVRASDGKSLWQFPWQTTYDANAADPIISGRTIFISSGYNRGCALLSVAGGRCTRLWENKNMRNHFNSCVLIKDHLYGFDESTLACVDLKTGRTAWVRGGLGKASLMAADGKLIVLSESGKLVIAEASPSGFTPLVTKAILSGRCWTTPVLSHGRVYARNAAGDLVCYGAG